MGKVSWWDNCRRVQKFKVQGFKVRSYEEVRDRVCVRTHRDRGRDRRNAVEISQLTALATSPIVGQLRLATKEERAWPTIC